MPSLHHHLVRRCQPAGRRYLHFPGERRFAPARDAVGSGTTSAAAANNFTPPRHASTTASEIPRQTYHVIHKSTSFFCSSQTPKPVSPPVVGSMRINSRELLPLEPSSVRTSPSRNYVSTNRSHKGKKHARFERCCSPGNLSTIRRAADMNESATTILCHQKMGSAHLHPPMDLQTHVIPIRGEMRSLMNRLRKCDMLGSNTTALQATQPPSVKSAEL